MSAPTSRRPSRVERNWARILDSADPDTGRITGAAVVELRAMAKLGLTEQRDGAWYRVPQRRKAFTPYVCGDCCTWQCLTCGHTRYWVNRWYAGVHRCPRCTSSAGEMVDSVHRHLPTGKRHRSTDHPDFAAQRLADALNAMEGAHGMLLVAGSREIRHRSVEVVGSRLRVAWNNTLRTWTAYGMAATDTDGQVNLK